MRRRDLLGLSTTGILGLPGCTSLRSPACDRYGSDAPEEGASGNDTPASDPCEDVQLPTDLTLRNKRDDTVTLSVTVTYRERDCEEVVYDRSFEVGSERTVQRFFRNFLRRGEDLPGSYYLAAQIGFWKHRKEISTNYPQIQTLHVTITGGIDRVHITQGHVDVSRDLREQYADCYWEG